MRQEEATVAHEMDQVQRLLRHQAQDLLLLDEEEQGLCNVTQEVTDELAHKKHDIAGKLVVVQDEISALLAQLRLLQQKEAALLSDMRDVDLQVEEENNKSELRSASIKTQVNFKFTTF
jgi:hypothetical protein